MRLLQRGRRFNRQSHQIFENPVSSRAAPPTLSQHTDEILTELLGLCEEQLKKLHDDEFISQVRSSSCMVVLKAIFTWPKTTQKRAFSKIYIINLALSLNFFLPRGGSSCSKPTVCGFRMSKALGTNREHERSTYQGIDVVAAPATVKVSFLTEARIPAT